MQARPRQVDVTRSRRLIIIRRISGGMVFRAGFASWLIDVTIRVSFVLIVLKLASYLQLRKRLHLCSWLCFFASLASMAMVATSATYYLYPALELR